MPLTLLLASKPEFVALKPVFSLSLRGEAFLVLKIISAVHRCCLPILPVLIHRCDVPARLSGRVHIRWPR